MSSVDNCVSKRVGHTSFDWKISVFLKLAFTQLDPPLQMWLSQKMVK